MAGGKKSASSAANLKLGVLWEELKRQHPELQSSSVMAILKGDIISSSYENLDMNLSHWDAVTRNKVKENINNGAVLSATDDTYITVVAELAATMFLKAHTQRALAAPGDETVLPPVPADPSQGYSTVETKWDDCPNRSALPDGKNSDFTAHKLLSLEHSEELGIDEDEHK